MIDDFWKKASEKLNSAIDFSGNNKIYQANIELSWNEIVMIATDVNTGSYNQHVFLRLVR